MSTFDDDRRGALLGAKLTGLVRARLPDLEQPEVHRVGRGAGLSSGDEGWFHVADDPRRALGPAVLWARSRGLSTLHVVVDRDAGVLARRGSTFRRPPRIWAVVDDALVEAAPDPVDEGAMTDLLEGTESLSALIEASGADVVVEHGVMTGQLAGLEIARVVPGAEGQPVLEVGVGRRDREAFGLLHGEVPAADALATVVDAVPTGSGRANRSTTL